MIRTKISNKIATHRNSFSLPSKQKLLLLFLYLFPFSLVVWFIGSFGIYTPYQDQWDLSILFYKIAEGTVGLSDFLAQHNEHRIAFPRIIFSILAFSSQWNIYWELFVSLAFAVATFLLLYRLGRETTRLPDQTQFLSHVPSFLMATLIFSLSQYQNWLWGFQLIWFLTNLCFIASIYMLHRASQSQVKYMWILAAIPCFIASFSSAHGMLTWIAAFPSIIMLRQNGRGWIVRLLAWLALFSMTLGLYLIDYSRPLHHPSLSFLESIPIRVMYFLAITGSSLSRDINIAIFIGLLMIGGFLYLAYYFSTTARSKLVSAAPWLSLGLYSLLFAGLTTVGRAGFGVEQAMSPRYRTITILFVVAVLQLGAIALGESRDVADFKRVFVDKSKSLSFKIFSLFLITVLLSFFINSYNISRNGVELRYLRETVGFCFNLVEYMEDVPSNTCRDHLYHPSLTRVQDAASQLESLDFRQISRGLDFLEHSPNSDIWGNIDVLGPQDASEPIVHGDIIPVSGWAADLDRGTVPQYVLFSYNDQRSFFNLAPVNVERPDVAEIFEDSQYLWSGWQTELASADLPAGEVLIRTWVFDPDNSRFVELVGSRVLRLGA